MRRVAITGMGALTPIGNDVKTFWENLKAGVVGVDRIKRFDPTGFQCQMTAELKDFQPELALEKKEVRRLDLFSQYACVAAKEAIETSGVKGAYDPTEIATIIGSGIGGLTATESECEVMRTKGNRRVTPFIIPKMICNAAAGHVAIIHGFQGPCCCPVTACATGANAIGDAWSMIMTGQIKAAVAGGTESAISSLGFAGFCNMTAMGTNNDDRLTASIPFDRRRNGFIMGEGAGAVILEEWDAAVKRGATIWAELKGYGMTCDAYHITAPASDGEGAKRSMQIAMDSARVTPTQIAYVNAHGTSTPLNDKLETLAIKKAFGDHARTLMVSSNKSMIGHTIGAAGAIEAIATVMTVREGIVPPTMGLHEPDPDCDLDYVPHKAREAKVDIAISNSFGFGGHNCTLCIGRA